MINFKKMFLYLLLFGLLSDSSLAERFMPEGQKVTTVDISWTSDSGLKLPTEGDDLNITFLISPYLDNINTNENFYVDYAIVKPNGDFAQVGYASFQKGPYLKNSNYPAQTSLRLTTPGIWQVYYVVTTNNDSQKIGNALFNSSSPEEYLRKVYLHSEEIHVLSFYESNSMKISNTSLLVSILGVIGTLAGVILVSCVDFIRDRYNYSPKIKVTCSHGFVTYANRPPAHVFNFEAKNYGRVAVTLSGIGIELKKQPKKEKEILHILESDVYPFKFPSELMPGKSSTVIRNYKKLKEDIKGKVPSKAYFKDQLGNYYYSTEIKKMFDLKPVGEGD